MSNGYKGTWLGNLQKFKVSKGDNGMNMDKPTFNPFPVEDEMSRKAIDTVFAIRWHVYDIFKYDWMEQFDPSHDKESRQKLQMQIEQWANDFTVIVLKERERLLKSGLDK